MSSRITAAAVISASLTPGSQSGSGSWIGSASARASSAATPPSSPSSTAATAVRAPHPPPARPLPSAERRRRGSNQARLPPAAAGRRAGPRASEVCEHHSGMVRRPLRVRDHRVMSRFRGVGYLRICRTFVKLVRLREVRFACFGTRLVPVFGSPTGSLTVGGARYRRSVAATADAMTDSLADHHPIGISTGGFTLRAATGLRSSTRRARCPHSRSSCRRFRGTSFRGC